MVRLPAEKRLQAAAESLARLPTEPEGTVGSGLGLEGPSLRASGASTVLTRRECGPWPVPRGPLLPVGGVCPGTPRKVRKLLLRHSAVCLCPPGK